MAATPSINPISSPNPSIPFTQTSQFTIPFRPNPSPPRFSSLRCSSSTSSGSNGGGGGSSSEQRETGGLKEVLSGIVDERVGELLSREENRVLLDGLDKATQRVEMAKRELAEIQKQEIEAKKMRAYINQLETRASEIEECQREISEAREMVEEAERVLGFGERGGGTEDERKAMYKNEERFESVKAASIAAIAGTLAGLPISLAQVTDNSQLILPSAITLFSCALFGVTFRYAIRRDLDDFQLKSGVCAAFGFVKGLATLGGGSPLELEVNSILSHAFNGAVYVSENLLIFFFAAVGLDFCIKLGILSPFPVERPDSTTNRE